MKRFLAVLFAFAALGQIRPLNAAEPLRVFIRAGEKSHAPGAHDFPQFLKDWAPMLNERGAKCEGSMEFPTREQLERTDVLILHAQEAGNIKVGEERKNLMEFLKRGGGLVIIHAAAVSRDHDWYKNIIGGSWKFGQTKWLEAPLSLYFTDRANPITRDISNFDLDDEIYYDMEMLPGVKVLAAAYTPKAQDTGGKGNQEAIARAAEAVAKHKGVNIYDIQPQMWTYERKAEGGSSDYRAFVCIPGHWYKNFSHNGLRSAILRGIAWAGKRDNVDELCKPAELGEALRYVEGGVPRPQELPKHLEVHPEFTVSLVASEPLINKPMNIDWDEKGRLWVVETPEYPNGLREANVEPWMDSGSLKPGQYQRDPQDRVSILSDSDGDGVMDKKQVFADKIELATSSVFYKNGVIVCSAPDIWYFQDADGDDKADKRTKLYTNLGIRDTHAVINNMRWGLDGWVYATHGYSSSDDVTSGDGSKSFGPIGAGVVRFKPDGSAFEQYASRGGNTWGLDITWDGQVFYTQPTTGNPLVHVVLPEYVLAKGKLPGVSGTNPILPGEATFPAISWEQQAYVQIDQVGRYTAGAGCAIYEGGAWPEKWNYSYFLTEPTLNMVGQFFVKSDGVSYKATKEPGREQTEFIRSRNLWFRPIEVRVGPDGALYVVDFCNQAVIHNDTRGPTHGPANAAVRPDRDHYYGRIWKVQHKDAKKLDVVKLDRSDAESLKHAIQSSPNVQVREEAWRLLDEQDGGSGNLAFASEKGMPRGMGSEAMAVYEAGVKANAEGRDKLLDQFAGATDDWSKSAIIAALAEAPAEAITTALHHQNAVQLAPLAEALVVSALQQKGDVAGKLVEACSKAGTDSAELCSVVLQSIAKEAAPPEALAVAVADALKKLLSEPRLAAAALPLVAKWDKKGSLSDEVNTQLARLRTLLTDNSAPAESRQSAAKALVEAGTDEDRTKVAAILSQAGSPELLQMAIITAMGESGHAGLLVGAMARLSPGPRSAAFEAMVKRPEAARALLAAVREGKIERSLFSPGDVARLRTHPNKQIARSANEIFKIDTSAKDTIIAKLIPEVEKPGDIEKGKMYFTAACAVCHKLGELGANVGPALDGMGAHGPAELLVHIIDPNREVDPSFHAHNITTRKGEVMQGVLTAENTASITLATQMGVREIAKTDIEKRENTHRSLMPEGLDALGGETLRDLLAFMCGDAQKHFRIVDLRPAYTMDSRAGMFAGPEPNQGRVKLVKFGNMTIEGIPFFIQDPGKSATGANVVCLKGGPGKSESFQNPQSVEVPVDVEAKKLHFLSGIAGWGFPAVKDEVPAMKVVVNHAGGGKEEFVLKNGVEFADYIRPVEVPGSALVEGLTEGQQVRLVSLKLAKPGAVKSLVLESFANGVAPVVLAITADVQGVAGAKTTAKSQKGPEGAGANTGPKEGGKGDAPLPPAAPIVWEPGKTKVLLVGGGSSHNFAEFFGKTDSATLKAAGFAVNYTEDRDQAAAEIGGADVAVVSVNRKFFDTPAYRKALMGRIAAGKGIVMLHPGTWYGYAEWPELNARVVGGGARGHDKLGPFEVKALKKDHPIMGGVPDSFSVVDELYYINAEPDKIPPGTAGISVLAETSPSQKFGRPHPSVWITENDKARIVGIALGHDERVHDLPAFKAILTNAVKWAAGK